MKCSLICLVVVALVANYGLQVDARVASAPSSQLRATSGAVTKGVSGTAAFAPASAGGIVSALAVDANKLKEMGKLFVLFTAWYGFNAGYNVYNAYVKKDFKYPWASSALQLACGILYMFPLWFLKIRAAPKLTKDDILKILPIGKSQYHQAPRIAAHGCPEGYTYL
jgi:hypothetical protein